MNPSTVSKPVSNIPPTESNRNYIFVTFTNSKCGKTTKHKTFRFEGCFKCGGGCTTKNMTLVKLPIFQEIQEMQENSWNVKKEIIVSSRPGNYAPPQRK